MHTDLFGISWSGWFPGMLLPSPYQEIIDGGAIVLAFPLWLGAGYLGLWVRAKYLKVYQEWKRLDEEAARSSI